jgi:hypothetical protein
MPNSALLSKRGVPNAYAAHGAGSCLNQREVGAIGDTGTDGRPATVFDGDVFEGVLGMIGSDERESAPVSGSGLVARDENRIGGRAHRIQSARVPDQDRLVADHADLGARRERQQAEDVQLLRTGTPHPVRRTRPDMRIIEPIRCDDHEVHVVPQQQVGPGFQVFGFGCGHVRRPEGVRREHVVALPHHVGAGAQKEAVPFGVPERVVLQSDRHAVRDHETRILPLADRCAARVLDRGMRDHMFGKGGLSRETPFQNPRCPDVPVSTIGSASVPAAISPADDATRSPTFSWNPTTVPGSMTSVPLLVLSDAWTT